MTSDLDLELAAELVALQLRTGQVAPFSSASSEPFLDPALVDRCLPDELLFEIFSRMTQYSLGRAACVCRNWRDAVCNPVFWHDLCLKAWQTFGVEENYKILQSNYEGSWKKMWLLRPRIRTDGLYISRNTHIYDSEEWDPIAMPYFRYLRFYPSGICLYKSSIENVKDMAKFMNFNASTEKCGYSGDYSMFDGEVVATFECPGLRPTVLRIRLRLRLWGTTAGANNRMDFLSLVNYNGVLSSPDEEALSFAPDVTQNGGLKPFIFVPFEEVETSDMNVALGRTAGR